MLGFRQTFNLSYDQGGNESALLCDDDLGSSVILVSLIDVCVHVQAFKQSSFPFIPLQGFIVAVLSIGCFVGALLAGSKVFCC